MPCDCASVHHRPKYPWNIKYFGQLNMSDQQKHMLAATGVALWKPASLLLIRLSPGLWHLPFRGGLRCSNDVLLSEPAVTVKKYPKRTALFRQPPSVGAHAARIMFYTTISHRFRVDTMLAHCQVKTEREIGSNLFAHHALGFFRRGGATHRHRPHPHGDHHVRFCSERPCVHAYAEPVGRLCFAGHISQSKE